MGRVAGEREARPREVEDVAVAGVDTLEREAARKRSSGEFVVVVEVDVVGWWKEGVVEEDVEEVERRRSLKKSSLGLSEELVSELVVPNQASKSKCSSCGAGALMGEKRLSIHWGSWRRPARLMARYWQGTPRLAQREQVGFCLWHLTLDWAQPSQLSRSFTVVALEWLAIV